MYSNKTIERYRFNIWQGNKKYVKMHNWYRAQCFTLALNEFADLTTAEFAKLYTGFTLGNRSNTSIFDFSSNPLPISVDWRTKGYVTPVQNQGACGFCWAFSAAGSLEGQHFRRTGNLVPLSEQNLIDCSGPQGNYGCGGGYLTKAFEYVISNNGIEDDATYPYKAQNGTCQFNSNNVAATCTDYKQIRRKSELELTQAIAEIGPISVAINAKHKSFQLYSKGVYYEPECSQDGLDHAVLAVGYGTTINCKEYYIVKNSWGTNWGTNGYILMSRNRNNNCGIATRASYPIV